MISPERWQQIERLFEAVTAREGAERTSFLERACGDDPALRREIESLLEADREARAFIEAPAVLRSHQLEGSSVGSVMIGQRFGHFHIVEKIGAGGMGEVYCAHDEQLDRDVAIKLLHPGTFDDPNLRARLLREARIASRLNHPHICTIYEVGEASGRAYIAMELVRGESLSSRLAGGPLSPEQVMRYGIQLADALAHAHNAGVIHRDLKSSNVVVTPHERIKVLDFGLAKRLLDDQPGETPTLTDIPLTAPGTIAGTPAYMAPEQLRGHPAKASSDVWALGVVLYELVSGVRPFRGETAFEVSSAILNQSAQPLPRDAPAELQRVIAHCLEKEAARRYQRGAEVLTALEAIQSPAALAQVPPQDRRLRRRALMSAAVLAAVGVALFAVGNLRERLLGTSPGGQIRAIAVLPIENLSGDPEQEYFADGFTDALITDLSKTKTLKVISRRSVMQYKKAKKPLREIATELGVEGIIEGSVLRAGTRARLTVQLIEAATETHLWADSYERDLQDVLGLQRDVAQAITREIRAAVTSTEQAQQPVRTVNPDTHEAFLKGMFYLDREERERALPYFQQAVNTDPTDPIAHAGLALGYALVGLGLVMDKYPDAFARARAAAQRAQELGGMLAETQLALGKVALYSDWNVASAETYLRSALELNPSLSEARREYAWYLNLVERRNDALDELKRAQEIDPRSANISGDLGYQYWMAGQYDAAMREGLRTIELRPSTGYAYGFWVLGLAHAAKGSYDEAIAAHQQYSDRALLARTYALAGRTADARKLVAQLQQERPVSARRANGLAAVYAALGDKDAAFRWLESAYQLREPTMPWLRLLPEWIPLRGDPRFEDLARRIGVPPQGWGR